MRALAAVAVALLCLLARDGSALETPQSRAAARIFATRKQREGGGFWVRRSVGSPALPELDPFLMLDHLGPTAYGPGEAVGAPDHPHRGFETVTYVLQGGFHHLDSAGNSGHLGPGAVQWMTAGRGVVHSEMPAKDLMRDGGVMEGFQLWVNLPAQHKMIAPRYQDIAPEDVPEAHGVNVSVRVIAGESILGTSAVIDTKIPITFLDVRLQPSGSLDETLPGDNAFAYVYRGDCTVAGVCELPLVLPEKLAHHRLLCLPRECSLRSRTVMQLCLAPATPCPFPLRPRPAACSCLLPIPLANLSAAWAPLS
eukprot:m.88846 g.88846  ORF g.88846 m.88846 type:complete len:310 (-) comp8515_c0_seq4:245-1174(-)